jgi:5'-nucleotidase
LVNHEWRETKGQMTDVQAVKSGYVSVTPIHLDMTSHDDIKELEQWI